MKRLWAFFHAMQIIESLNLIYAASLPMNASIFQNGYHDIINAKLIPDFVVEKIKGAFLSDDPDKPSLLRMLGSSASKKKNKNGCVRCVWQHSHPSLRVSNRSQSVLAPSPSFNQEEYLLD